MEINFSNTKCNNISGEHRVVRAERFLENRFAFIYYNVKNLFFSHILDLNFELNGIYEKECKNCENMH